MQQDNLELNKKRIKAGRELDQAYSELFTTNESLKLFNKTQLQLNNADDNEKACIVTLKSNIKTLKELLSEEKI